MVIKPKTNNRRKISIDFNDDEGSSSLDHPGTRESPSTSSTSSPTRPVFKKIKKQEAQRIKGFPSKHQSQVNKLTSLNNVKNNGDGANRPSTMLKPKLSLQELASKEKQTYKNDNGYQQGSLLNKEDEDNDNFSDTSLDREWYTNERANHYEDLELETNNKATRNRTSLDTFDPFEDDPEDYENHRQQQIVSHHLIPPFLEDEQIIANQKAEISVIRDPEGHLAAAARRGSNLVNERRVQSVIMKKNNEVSAVKGTKLGNVMGIKDKEEKIEHKNFIEAMEDSSSPLDIAEQRRCLPAFTVREDLIRTIRENQIVVVIGETGSGKTTQLTQFLYEEGFYKRGIIGCTQPRRVAAMSVAKRVSEEMGVKLGNEVGFTIRFEDRTSPRTMIKYMTDGVLLRETLLDSGLEKYSCIIMDEAHERSLNTDILLGLFKKILTKRRDLRLIITSATMNASRFSEFFGNADTFTIPGRTFPVDIQFSKYPVADYVDAAIKQVLKIHYGKKPGDILVFMTGQEDIEATCQVLQERIEEIEEDAENKNPLSILPIYSSLPADLQAKVFGRSEVRKCIVATNIAETSLTVDGIVFVVDAGLCKLKVYSSKLGMDILQLAPISFAQANQRSGRAGRTGPGVAYRLYTLTEAEKEMYVQPIPEIQRTNLANTLLLIKSLGVDNLLDFPFIDPPPHATIYSSLYDLWCLDAIDNLGALTDLGHKMTSFPMEPVLSKMLIKSHEFKCSTEMCIIVAMLSVPNVFYRPKERQKESDRSRERFFIPESDHLTLLNVYNQWLNHRNSARWCVQNFLHEKSLRRAQEIELQLQSIMMQQGMACRSIGRQWDPIQECICSCLFVNAARFKKFGEYTNLRSVMSMVLHPTSSLYGTADLPEYVVFQELLLTSREYMNVVTAVKPEWLAKYGSVFYSARSDHEAVLSRLKEAMDDAKKKWNQLETSKTQKVVTNVQPKGQIGIRRPRRV
ncbi:RNA helicase involved in splicing [Komagataella phaffii CBS 7435]|uniref:Pre-mRNA-splicing factor ATP-dependent RNA helicase PRP16 n=2 Tax=Komagataella phaffii TaxID=460519 RepID=C4QXR9_KOMPG|nr:uncharacterized protein PAS_chr1-4_0661 [Komagataella phaffii GS115]AOA61325.1 GQ67_01972T0 [Komagataella phaffii]CAH2446859.1 RNA helicase involved in splicing [Komagataella phaffii CBS 7435]AOA65445.1 GQ68_01987T0 [Komagataella phaffii GS115]CAY68042.1 hypothetical protein PAS_chr1-4_0661 [Komagataella phaffii GS115]SCV11884.1 RNA helicase involved in splicing [Komagataella phaffii CBS 7435]